MKITVFLVVLHLTFVLATFRIKRTAYELQAGFRYALIDELKTTFKCSDDGYYVDVDNNCQVFHICHTITTASGESKILQWSFFCGNFTIFNQNTLTCTYPDGSTPCEKIKDYALNRKLKESTYDYIYYGLSSDDEELPPPDEIGSRAKHGEPPKLPDIPNPGKVLKTEEQLNGVPPTVLEPKLRQLHYPPIRNLSPDAEDKIIDARKGGSLPPKIPHI